MEVCVSFVRCEGVRVDGVLMIHLGSALAANLRAAQACLVTTISASIGGMTWMLWVYLFLPINRN